MEGPADAELAAAVAFTGAAAAASEKNIEPRIRNRIRARLSLRIMTEKKTARIDPNRVIL